MPKTKISEYSTTNADNTDIESINIAEGCAPSGINNAIRELMVHLKEFQTGASGDGFTFAGGTLMTGTNTLSGTNVLSGSTTAAFAAGTVSAPSIAAHGDTNTGIFFPAADTIAFAEGGAEAMRIDSSGNVGIGTTSIVGKLDIASSTAALNNGICFVAPDLAGADNGLRIGLRYGTNSTIRSSIAFIFSNLENSFNSYITFGTGNSNTERMRIDSSGNVLFNGTSAIDSNKFQFYGQKAVSSGITQGQVNIADTNAYNATGAGGALSFSAKYNSSAAYTTMGSLEGIKENTTDGNYAGALVFRTRANGGNNDERMRIDSSGNVGIGTTSPSTAANGGLTLGTTSAGKSLILNSSSSGNNGLIRFIDSNGSNSLEFVGGTSQVSLYGYGSRDMLFWTSGTERARIDSGGNLFVGKTASDTTVKGAVIANSGFGEFIRDGGTPGIFGRLTNDGDLVAFYRGASLKGSISVSGETVSYNSFAGSHWTQLQQGRGYNPEIPRGTVMSSIGEMAEWKSVVWDEVIEHPAIAAVEAVEGKEAVLDEEGNVIEFAIEAVAAIEGKDAWTETINKREAYLGDLPVGATFTEDGVTKAVVDDGNERLPKVKISDVVGDKAVYGVFQTYDEVQDMLVTALGAFVVRIAAGVTVQIGDLLESNGDGCAKVQDDDVIRSKTIGKVTSTVKTATYADGSYTVPCVLYCG